MIIAKTYKNYFDLGDNFYVKIPVIPEGYKAIRILKDVGMNVTATAVFTQQQAMELLNQLVRHPMTDISVKTFIEDGKGLYDIS